MRVGHDVLIAPTRDRNCSALRGSKSGIPSSHCPYEGSQQVNERHARDIRAGSHCPYEGSQHVPQVTRGQRGLVLIAPTRDRNYCASVTRVAARRSHCPYEGSQPVDPHHGAEPTFRFSLPLRGIATPEAERRADRARRGSHCPYEGSQPRAHRTQRPRRPRVLIAPTRDRNRGGSRWPCSKRLFSLPLRGIATAWRARWSVTGSRSHCPYEGSQHRHHRVHHVLRRWFSLPLRGIATSVTSIKSGDLVAEVLIAPTRDRNIGL